MTNESQTQSQTRSDLGLRTLTWAQWSSDTLTLVSPGAGPELCVAPDWLCAPQAALRAPGLSARASRQEVPTEAAEEAEPPQHRGDGRVHALRHPAPPATHQPRSLRVLEAHRCRYDDIQQLD